MNSQSHDQGPGLGSSRLDPLPSWPSLELSAGEWDKLRAFTAELRQDAGANTGQSAGSAPSLIFFTGAGGAAKTMAAQSVAGQVATEIYRITPEHVSKYIGETEKNLTAAFAGVAAGALLFFDEADALFGRRSQVKDAHDRYANLEVSELFRLLEAYPGRVIVACEDPAPELLQTMLRFTSTLRQRLLRADRLLTFQ